MFNRLTTLLRGKQPLSIAQGGEMVLSGTSIASSPDDANAWDWRRNDIALDLGSSAAKAAYNGQVIFKDGKPLMVPTYIAYDKRKRSEKCIKSGIWCIGAKAKEYEETIDDGNSDVAVERVVRGGKIQSEKIALHFVEKLITEYFGERSRMDFRAWPNVILGITPGTNWVISENTSACCKEAIRASNVVIVDQTMAAMIGSGALIESECMVMDIGGGSTDIAVIKDYNPLFRKSLPIAGDVMNDLIKAMVARSKKIEIDTATAERIKIEVGAALPPDKLNRPPEMTRNHYIGKRDNGHFEEFEVTTDEVAAALTRAIKKIKLMAQNCTRGLSPTLSQPLKKHGMALTGRQAQLAGLSQILEDTLGLPVHVSSNAEIAVISGLCRIQRDPTLTDKVKLA
jgi:rod shape-determining protein MreB